MKRAEIAFIALWPRLIQLGDLEKDLELFHTCSQKTFLLGGREAGVQMWSRTGGGTFIHLSKLFSKH